MAHRNARTTQTYRDTRRPLLGSGICYMYMANKRKYPSPTSSLCHPGSDLKPEGPCTTTANTSSPYWTPATPDYGAANPSWWQSRTALRPVGKSRRARTISDASRTTIHHETTRCQKCSPCAPRTRLWRSPFNSARTRCISHAPLPPTRSCVDAGVKCAEGGLADRGDLARKSPTTPSLLDPGVPRASVPPLYTQVDHWSCSVALRFPPTWLSMRARGGGPWGRNRAKPLLRQHRQQRHPCAPRMCPGRQHSNSKSTYTLGHTPFAPEHGIAIFAPAPPLPQS